MNPPLSFLWAIALLASCFGVGCTGEIGRPKPVMLVLPDTGVRDVPSDALASDVPSRPDATVDAATDSPVQDVSHEESGRCGDGEIQQASGEVCDGAEFGGASCVTLGFDGGDLRCDPGCQLDDSGCTVDQGVCGDNVIGGSEVCDGTALGGTACGQLTYEHDNRETTFPYTGAGLGCLGDCTGFDTSGCGQGNVGDACTGSSDCGPMMGLIHLHGGTCMITSPGGTTFPDGYCTASCEDGYYEYCCRVAHGQCVTVPAAVGSGRYCLKECTGSAGCRPGYECSSLEGGTYCLPL